MNTIKKAIIGVIAAATLVSTAYVINYIVRPDVRSWELIRSVGEYDVGNKVTEIYRNSKTGVVGLDTYIIQSQDSEGNIEGKRVDLDVIYPSGIPFRRGSPLNFDYREGFTFPKPFFGTEVDGAIIISPLEKKIQQYSPSIDV